MFIKSLHMRAFFLKDIINKSTLDNSSPPLLNLKLLRTQGQIIDVKKCEKSQLIGHFNFFSAIIELVRELLISRIHNKFVEDTWKTFQVIAPTRSNYRRIMRKIAINRLINFFSPLL